MTKILDLPGIVGARRRVFALNLIATGQKGGKAGSQWAMMISSFVLFFWMFYV